MTEHPVKPWGIWARGVKVGDDSGQAATVKLNSGLKLITAGPGINTIGEIAADGIEEDTSLINIVATTSTLADGIKTANENIDKLENDVKTLNEAVGINKNPNNIIKNTNAISNLQSSVNGNYDNLTKQINDAEQNISNLIGTSSDTSETSPNTLFGDIDGIKNTVDSIKKSVGENLSTTVSSAEQNISNLIGTSSDTSETSPNTLFGDIDGIKNLIGIPTTSENRPTTIFGLLEAIYDKLNSSSTLPGTG